jgi:ParB-like chromosome segregation protein Spo0J
MASNSKFNLTQLLNARSKEVAAVDTAAEEKETTTEAVTATADIYDLIPSKDNFYSTDSVEDLKQSIELLGILQPLLVTSEENGKRRIIAGHRRRLAIMQLVDEGKERFRYVPIMVKPTRDAIIDRLALIMTNRFREKTDWEKMTEALETEKLVLELKEQMDIPGRTRDLLSEIVDTSPAQLGRYKAINNNLTPEMMAEFKAGNIGVSIVYEVSGMKEEWQLRALQIYKDHEALTLPDIKTLKKQQEAAEQIPGQQSIDEYEEEQNKEESVAAGQEEEADTTPEYIDPQPETITSLCYSCTKYETCNDKKSTVTSCNAYIDKKEAYKTDEQRYNEEQAKIDAETRKKLREQQHEEKMAAGPTEKPHEEIRLPGSRYEEITSGALTFLLLKKDGYKLGEELTLPEYTNGRATGRTIEIKVSYIWEDYTGLDDNYCIVGFDLMSYTPLEAVAEMAAAYADQPTLQQGA